MLTSLFQKKSTDWSEIKSQKFKVIDVRTKGEFSSGHLKGSVNMPLNELEKLASTLDKNETIITCCASGMRSASAKSVLEKMGFTNVINGGPWENVQYNLK